MRAEFGDVERAGGRDATLILRDLAVRKRELSGADRALAEALLARPDDGDVPVEGTGYPANALVGHECSDPNVCVHWAESPPFEPDSVPDAPPGEDDEDTSTIPGWVTQVQTTWAEVWAHQIDGLGYRAPQDDSDSTPNNGGDGKLDVYVADIGDAGVFGYCASDDPAFELAVSAYCVVDNDYGPAQYGVAHTPLEFLQVTSAHEFNHASQFAYDAQEDAWLMEGTATNMEETAYPEVDDNVFFLSFFSPLTRPRHPLDRGGFFDSEYGAWIFWRYLEEKVAGGDATIVREIWERADAAGPGAPDAYSLQAARKEMEQRGQVFRDAFMHFAVQNRLRRYSDAVEAGYPWPQPRRLGVGLRRPNTGWREWRIDHLASLFLAYEPGQRVPRRAKIRIDVRIPRYRARARVLVFFEDGRVGVRKLTQDATGAAGRRFSFGRDVKRVEVALTNSSTRMDCWQNFDFPPLFSCAGIPRDDGSSFRVRARLVG